MAKPPIKTSDSSPDRLKRIAIAREAAETMHAGFYSGPPMSDRIDELVYGASARRPRRARKAR